MEKLKKIIDINCGSGMTKGMIHIIMGMRNCGKSLYVSKEMSDQERNARYEKAKSKK